MRWEKDIFEAGRVAQYGRVGGGVNAGEGLRKGRSGSLSRKMKAVGKKARMKIERKRRVDVKEVEYGMGSILGGMMTIWRRRHKRGLLQSQLFCMVD